MDGDRLLAIGLQIPLDGIILSEVKGVPVRLTQEKL
jgi:hypothetical protein